MIEPEESRFRAHIYTACIVLGVVAGAVAVAGAATFVALAVAP